MRDGKFTKMTLPIRGENDTLAWIIFQKLKTKIEEDIYHANISVTYFSCTSFMEKIVHALLYQFGLFLACRISEYDVQNFHYFQVVITSINIDGNLLLIGSHEKEKVCFSLLQLERVNLTETWVTLELKLLFTCSTTAGLRKEPVGARFWLGTFLQQSNPKVN